MVTTFFDKIHSYSTLASPSWGHIALPFWPARVYFYLSDKILWAKNAVTTEKIDSNLYKWLICKKFQILADALRVKGQGIKNSTLQGTTFSTGLSYRQDIEH